MGINILKWFREKTGTVSTKEVTCRELLDAALEYQIRELCFWVCVDMVANAMGRCEFRTFLGGEEVNEREYYLWNYEPNTNQNATAFMHKLIARLYMDNEALVIGTKKRDGTEAVVVADSWTDPDEYPTKQNEYRDVVVGDMTYNKTFRENDVLHLKLNHGNMRQVVNALYQSYYKLVETAMKSYTWEHGQHWKVHVNQIASGEEGWEKRFQTMISEQVKPFLESGGAILPEFDGYAYTNEGKSSGTSKEDTRDIKALIEDIFDFTARGFLIPAVLVNGKIEGTEDANSRFLTNCIDPLCDQLQEEITRKRYGYQQWSQGNFVRVDSSSILHFDIFKNAANIEKLVGSGTFTINDLLRAANQPTIQEPWADSHFMTKNISPMSQVVNEISEKGEKA